MQTTEFKPLAILRARRSKNTFKFFWNTENHYVYIEEKDWLGSRKVKTKIIASSWEMAYHAAEAYVFEK